MSKAMVTTILPDEIERLEKENNELRKERSSSEKHLGDLHKLLRVRYNPDAPLPDYCAPKPADTNPLKTIQDAEAAEAEWSTTVEDNWSRVRALTDFVEEHKEIVVRHHSLPDTLRSGAQIPSVQPSDSLPPSQTIGPMPSSQPTRVIPAAQGSATQPPFNIVSRPVETNRPIVPRTNSACLVFNGRHINVSHLTEASQKEVNTLANILQPLATDNPNLLVSP
ncbi:hypothetical protein NUH87_30895 [Pseudomonas batumici]|uniref:hypothetical protein n=1 Tax=Pseudomonas batumici TaxID=226910 RepID=UPI0030D30572